jgi:hypothetical protein
MPTETEELRLQVVLDDQATEELARLRQELQQVGSLSALSGLERATLFGYGALWFLYKLDAFEWRDLASYRSRCSSGS